MKKWLLKIGLLTLSATPLVVVISCGGGIKEPSQSGATTIAQWKAKYPLYANKIKGNKIVESAFNSFSLPPGFYIPGGVTSIGNFAFQGATFSSDLVIPNSVTSIDEGTFAYATFNSDLVIPDSVTSIKSSAFQSATFSSNLDIPNSVTLFWENIFYGIKTIDSNGSFNNHHWEDGNNNTVAKPMTGGKLIID